MTPATASRYVTAVGDSLDAPQNRNGETMQPIRCHYCDRELEADEVVVRLKVVRRPHGNRQWYGTTYPTCCLDCGLEYTVSETTSAKDMGRVVESVGFPSFVDWLRDEETDLRDVFTALHRSTRCERCDRPLYLPRMDGRVAPICHPSCEGRREADCATCGESFEPTRSDAKYCSGACRQKAYRQRKQERPAGTCVTCGGGLPPDRADARWCSPKCATKQGG